MSDNNEYAWIDVMRNRNRLQALFLNNSHSYEEKFSLNANGMMLTSIIGGEDSGIMIHTMIVNVITSIDNHFKELKSYYEKHKQDIPKNYKS